MVNVVFHKKKSWRIVNIVKTNCDAEFQTRCMIGEFYFGTAKIRNKKTTVQITQQNWNILNIQYKHTTSAIRLNCCVNKTIDVCVSSLGIPKS